MISDLDFFSASNDEDIQTIDLHKTSSIVEALEELEIEISRFLVDKKYCRVIYGIGEGKMYSAVKKYLDNSKYISDRKEEKSGGSCIVFF